MQGDGARTMDDEMFFPITIMREVRTLVAWIFRGKDRVVNFSAIVLSLPGLSDIYIYIWRSKDERELIKLSNHFINTTLSSLYLVYDIFITVIRCSANI